MEAPESILHDLGMLPLAATLPIASPHGEHRGGGHAYEEGDALTVRQDKRTHESLAFEEQATPDPASGAGVVLADDSVSFSSSLSPSPASAHRVEASLQTDNTIMIDRGEYVEESPDDGFVVLDSPEEEEEEIAVSSAAPVTVVTQETQRSHSDDANAQLLEVTGTKSSVDSGSSPIDTLTFYTILPSGTVSTSSPSDVQPEQVEDSQTDSQDDQLWDQLLASSVFAEEWQAPPYKAPSLVTTKEDEDGQNEAESKDEAKSNEMKATRKRRSTGKASQSGKKSEGGAKRLKTESDDSASKGAKSKGGTANKEFLKPLQAGWRRELVTRQTGASALIRKDVYYFAPDGKKLRSSVEVGRYLKAKDITDLSVANFSFNQNIKVALTETRLALKDFGNAFGYLDNIASMAQNKRKKSKPKKSRAKREKEAEERKVKLRRRRRRSAPSSRTNRVKKSKLQKPVLLRIADISNGQEPVPIECINVRSDEPPESFEYIRESVIDPSIQTASTLFACCTCTDGCTDPNICECAKMTCQFGDGDPTAPIYDSNNCLLGDLPIIFECNDSCKCKSAKCNNRNSQLGIRLKLQLYKTKHKGWGVRTLTDIPSGSFVMEYAGEILSNEIAETVQSDRYLLDLDVLEVLTQRRQMAEQKRLEEEKKEDEAPVEVQKPKKKKRRRKAVSWSSKGSKSHKKKTSPVIETIVIDDDEPDEANLKSSLEAERNDGTNKINDAGEHNQESSSAQFVDKAKEGKEDKAAEWYTPLQLASAESGSTEGMSEKTQIVLDDENADSDWFVAVRSQAKDKEDQTQRPLSKGKEKADEMEEEEQVNEGELAGEEEEGANETNAMPEGMRMQYYGEEEPYVVNPHRRGNLARFLNHSCSPNLWTVSVVSKVQDLRFSKACFFAAFDIPAGTELTWDYAMKPGPSDPVPCHCNAADCRKFLC